jgi:hypothetical protein
MGVENLVEIVLANEDDFLKVRETLTRIGVASKRDNILYQSCHILHKRGKYYIVHFKEMFLLDGKPSSIDDTDLGRRNAICSLLQQWELIKVVDNESIKQPMTPISQIKILPFKEKANWQLVAKYSIGKAKKVEPQ